MTRSRFLLVALAGLLASLVFADGSARAAFITRFDGQFDGISTAPPFDPVQDGTGQKIFYLFGGIVSSTTDPSSFDNQALNRLMVDVTRFIQNPGVGSVTNFDINVDNPDPTLLKVGLGIEGGIHADFTMADTASLTSDLNAHKAVFNIGVTLRASSNPGNNDLSAFNTGGGGMFSIEIDNVDITPSNDGRVTFPVDPKKPVTVKWAIVATPVPEPASAVSLLTGAGVLGLWVCRRKKG
jgi:hypothetical protein